MAKPVIVREVWQSNIDEEFHRIHNAILRGYLSAAIDTEFPGTIFNPLPPQVYSNLLPQVYYPIMKRNVDNLRIIQLGLTLFDAYGNHIVWQFNFRDFDKEVHPHSRDSIYFLEKQGINFRRNNRYGIDSLDFADKLRSLVLPYRLTWITFQGSYDFGLLIKIMTGRELPGDVRDFMTLMGAYFGVNTCDLKLITSLLGIHGGLEKVGTSLGLARVTGTSHQAGPDSLLTMQVFLELRRRRSCVDKFIGMNNKLYGLTIMPGNKHQGGIYSS